MQGTVAMRTDTAPAEELVLVTVADVPKADPAYLEQTASLVPQIVDAPIAILSPNALPAVELASTDDSAQESSRASPDAGDPAVRALMFGRYIGQISARIERAWVRPRSPVNDVTARNGGAASGISDEIFTCRAQIRQDARGHVQEVLLLDCNGTEAWRRSLVVAINQSSPLPAPPIPNVFTQAITMTFEANEYRAGDDPDAYELETRALVTSDYARSTEEPVGTVKSAPNVVIGNYREASAR